MKTECGGWIWILKDPSLLDPWAEKQDPRRNTAFKRNGVRSVFRVQDSSGHAFFVKMEYRPGFLNRLRDRFFSKAESECRSGGLLKKCGIPCAEYCGWGYHPDGGSAVISRSLEGYVSAMEFWYSKARFDDELKEKWFSIFFRLTSAFQENSLLHPDFHSANVMLDPKTLEYSMIDAYGIGKVRTAAERLLHSNLAWLLPLRMDIPVPELAERIDRAGLLKKKALPFLQEMIRKNEFFLAHDWQKRRLKQIRSGNSKFSHTENGREIRHTLWYEPVPLPPETQMERRVLPLDAAEKIWIDSFRNQLFCRKNRETPLIYQKEDASGVLFFEKNAKKSFFS